MFLIYISSPISLPLFLIMLVFFLVLLWLLLCFQEKTSSLYVIFTRLFLFFFNVLFRYNLFCIYLLSLINVSFICSVLMEAFLVSDKYCPFYYWKCPFITSSICYLNIYCIWYVNIAIPVLLWLLFAWCILFYLLFLTCLCLWI